MKVRATRIILLMFCIVLCMSSMVDARPAKEGSFLTNHAETISDVINQVESNRLVALRYARHFKTEPSSLLIFLRNELTLVTLQNDLHLTRYFIDSSRSIVSEDVNLGKGIKVFANRAGLPILEFGSGNPLTSNLSSAGLPEPKVGGGAPEVIEAKAPDTSTVADSAPASATESAIVVEQPSIESATPVTDDVLTSAPPMPTVNADPVLVAKETAPATSGISSISNWLIPVGLAGTGLAVISSGSSRSNGIPIDSPQDPRYDDPVDPVIPEPASAMVLGSGILSMAAFIKYRRRK